MVDTEPWELPKWNEATPLAAGLAWVAHRRLIIRSAPTALAVAARSASDGLRPLGRDRKVSMAMAVIRPSRRLAKSHKMSASLIGPDGVWMISPWSGPPRPGSTTIRLPESRGPDRRTSSSPRIACGEPPVTREARKFKERNVSGPQMPSAYKPYSR
nr:hypothetical protein CPGR_05121 [Mycolicibacter nonchromogenicus]